MRGWFAKRKYGGVACMSAALLWLVCLTAPAQAFWGDYGAEPPPEIFGVRLGDDIRNYKGMKLRQASYDPYQGAYQRKADEGLTFAGVPLWGEGTDSRPYYATYKNKIGSIKFSVRPEDYEAVAHEISAMFGPPKEKRESPIGWKTKYIWMNSEVFVDSDRAGSFDVRWLPIEKKLYGSYATKWNKPVAFEGVTLGGEIEDYPFLKEIYREGPDVIHYVSEKPLPQGMDNCIFSAYRGNIYGFTLIFNEYTPGLGGVWPYTMGLLDLEWDRDKFFHFFGDVQVDWLSNDVVYARLTLIYWEANRARIAYYRNAKTD